jgi:predicted ABC-type sugar transport system permease subunit
MINNQELNLCLLLSYNQIAVKNQNKNQNGFIPMLVMIALVLLALIYFVFKRVHSAGP